MCYNSPPCKYFFFNPRTGNDTCTKPSNGICAILVQEREFEEEWKKEEEQWKKEESCGK